MKIKFIKYSILLLAFTAFIFKSPIQDLLLKLQSYHYYFPQEKVYLHLNKDIYTNGETIWFKAYLVDAMLHQQDTLSGTLYVDLINADQNEIVNHHMLKVKDGVAHGDFALSDSLPPATYQVRAYTKWMRNFDPDYYFSKTFNLYHPDIIKQEWEVTSRVTRYETMDSVQLYFEMKPPLPSEIGPFDYEIRRTEGTLIDEGMIWPYQQGYFSFNIEIPSLDTVPEVLVKLWNRFKTERFVVTLNDQPRLQFFPEGGDIVADLVNAVAFEATDSNGDAIEVTGELVDQDGNEVIPINTIHEGRGLIFFKPESGKKYQARVSYKDQDYFYSLPESMPEGLVISAINSFGNKLDLRIYRKDLSGKFDGSFIVVGQVRGKAYFANRFELEKDVGRLRIPKNTFPTGVLQLTVFNEENQPLAERLAFINHHDFLNIEIKPDKNTYSAREKVSLDIKTSHTAGNMVPASLSASVVDADQLPVENKENIISYLMLSSDLKGDIENPAQYFQNQDKKTEQKLDLLMLTRGWRRFCWEDLMAQKYPDISFYPENGFEISGQVTRLWNDNKPAEDREITMFAFGKAPIIANTRSDSLGRFSFPNMEFYDSISLVIQTANKRGTKREMNLYLDSLSFPDIEAEAQKLPLNTTIYKYLKLSEERKQIELAYIRDTSAVMLDELLVEGRKEDEDENVYKIYGSADVTLKPNDNDVSGAYYITDYLVGRVAGLQVNGAGADANVVIRGASSFLSGNGPLWLLDGMPVDQSTINTIPLQNIESIDILKNAGNTAIYGSRGANGVIAVYTKRGEFYQAETRGIINTQFQGYKVPREFYAPNYDTKKDEHVMPDRRAVIYWAPDLRTDSLGNTSFSFHNADLKTKIKVIVQGISKDGIPGYQELNYEVR